MEESPAYGSDGTREDIGPVSDQQPNPKSGLRPGNAAADSPAVSHLSQLAERYFYRQQHAIHPSNFGVGLVLLYFRNDFTGDFWYCPSRVECNGFCRSF